MPQGGLAPIRGTHAMHHPRRHMKHRSMAHHVAPRGQAGRCELHAHHTRHLARHGLVWRGNAKQWLGAARSPFAPSHPSRWELLPAQQCEWQFATQHAKPCKTEPNACPLLLTLAWMRARRAASWAGSACMHGSRVVEA